jgi:acetolactate synthase-1/2/3 large subunit
MTLATRLPELFHAPTPDARGAALLLRTFASHGVRAAFGIPGGAVGPVYDALAEVPEIELVSTRHETTAVFAALGHARATGVPALVLVTAGPGVTNTVTGVASALLEETPVIVLGGEVATTAAGRGSFQDGSSGGLDVVALMRGVTRWSSLVSAPSMAVGAAERAFATATGERPGPVFLSVPYDVGQGFAPPPRIARAIATTVERPDPAACAAAAQWLQAAKRPLLVLGNGARSASAEALALAELLSIPVVVTGHAKGVFPESHPLYLGIIGNAGHPSAADYVASRPDVICIVGSRVGDFATNGWAMNLTGTMATIQIDREPWLIGRNVSTTLGVVGDAACALDAITGAAPPASRRVSHTPSVASRRVREWSPSNRPGIVKPQEALAALAAAFPDAVWCSDIGEHMGFAQHYLTVDRPDRFHCMSGLGSMGSGLGAAIGFKQARPEATVIAIVGDGGFNMHAAEVLTCVEHGIGLVFAIFNDGRWNMVEHGFRAVFRRRPAGLPEHKADLAAVARGYGADAYVVDDLDHLVPERLRVLANPRKPVVLDIRIDPSESLSVESRSAALWQLLGAGTR